MRGRAGETATLTLSQPLRLGNGGADTTSTSSDGGWSGVGVLRPWKHARDAAYYVAVDIPESVRCPGGSCPYPGGWAEPPVFSHGSAADGGITFAPGRYTVVLLGAPGSTVSVTISNRTGRAGQQALRTSGRATALVGDTGQSLGAPGNDVAARLYREIPATGRIAYAAVYGSYTFAPAGAGSAVGCATSGPGTTVVSNLGGVGPCADAHGTDAPFGPWPLGLGEYDVTPAAGVIGPADVPIGAGIDMHGAAPSSWLRPLFVGFSL